MAVFENKSPSFGPGLPPPGEPTADPVGGRIEIVGSRPGYGRCEVVCFGPDRTGSWGDLTMSRARTIVEAWADRTAALSALPGIEQVYVFENRGREIGVTLLHPHGQIYGYPYITPRTRRLLASIDSYGPALMADILAAEQKSERVLIRGEHFTVFVPFAARWPIEIHMLPHRHVPDFAATTDAERGEIALLYRADRARDRRALRHPDPLHRRLAPGAGPGLPGPGPADAPGHLAAPGSGQAQVPGRVRDRDGGLHRRRRPRGVGRADQGRAVRHPRLTDRRDRPSDRPHRLTAPTGGTAPVPAHLDTLAEATARGFADAYGRDCDGVWSAPGRVNLIGEHTDYNEGFVLPFAIGARTSVAARRRNDGLLALASAQFPGKIRHLKLAKIRPRVGDRLAGLPGRGGVGAGPRRPRPGDGRNGRREPLHQLRRPDRVGAVVLGRA